MTDPAVLYDGIVGAVIGSAVTALAVVATIRHDSNSRRRDRLDDAVANAQAAVDVLSYTVIAEGLKSPTTRSAMRSALQAVPVVVARARKKEPELAALVNDGGAELSAALSNASYTTLSEQDVIQTAQRLSVALLSWFGRTKEIQHGSFTYDDVRTLVEEPPEA